MKQPKYIVAVLICAILAIGVNADTSYSTENDPLVTLSYIEKIKEQILNELLTEINSGTLNITTNDDIDSKLGYEVVELKQGQSVMAANSCEMIFRSGKATVVIASETNKANSIGLSDLTKGAELLNGDEVPVNHYIIIPRADGRGIKITSPSAYLMIRGEYEIVTE